MYILYCTSGVGPELVLDHRTKYLLVQSSGGHVAYLNIYNNNVPQVWAKNWCWTTGQNTCWATPQVAMLWLPI